MKPYARVSFFCSAFFLVIGACAAQVDGREKKLSPLCEWRLHCIDQDALVLYSFFKQIFETVGKCNKPEYKPLSLLNWLIKSSQQSLSQRLQYGSFVQYMSFILNGHGHRFDKVYEAKYAELSDIPTTWYAFQLFFMDEVLKPTLVGLKKDLKTKDQSSAINKEMSEKLKPLPLPDSHVDSYVYPGEL